MEIDDFNKAGLVYDLRQHWAKLLGQTLELIAEARLEKDFPSWYANLINIKTDVSYKFKKDDWEEYNQLHDTLMNEIKKSEYAYSNQNAQHEQRGNIENQLRLLNEFLIRMLDKHKIFGAKEDVEYL